MASERDVDPWERAVCAASGAFIGAVVGALVETVRVALSSGTSLSVVVVCVFAFVGALVGLIVGQAVTNGLVAVFSFLFGVFSVFVPEYWLTHRDSHLGWER
jgi:hypothetical protein